jgi:hypothetical protein
MLRTWDPGHCMNLVAKGSENRFMAELLSQSKAIIKFLSTDRVTGIVVSDGPRTTRRPTTVRYPRTTTSNNENRTIMMCFFHLMQMLCRLSPRPADCPPVALRHCGINFDALGRAAFCPNLTRGGDKSTQLCWFEIGDRSLRTFWTGRRNLVYCTTDWDLTDGGTFITVDLPERGALCV